MNYNIYKPIVKLSRETWMLDEVQNNVHNLGMIMWAGRLELMCDGVRVIMQIQLQTKHKAYFN